MNTQEDTTVNEGVALQVSDVSLEATRILAYKIKNPLAGELEIYSSPDNNPGPRPIWEDKDAVKRLIDGAVSGLTIAAMYTYAGMTKTQYFSFRQVNPHWDEYLERCRQHQMIQFMKVINKKGVGDLPTARWYMEHRHPDFGSKAKPEVDEPLQPTVNIAIGTNADAGIVQATIREIAREIFGSRRTDTGGSEVGSTADMAGAKQE